MTQRAARARATASGSGSGSGSGSASASASAPPARGELSIVDALAQLSFLIHTTLERRASERDLSIIQARLLGILRDRTPSMNQLAKLLGLDKSSVTGLVDRAERRGLVERVSAPADQRSVLVKLTATGRSYVSAAAADFETDVEAIVNTLSAAGRRTLTDLVTRILVAHAAGHGVDLFATTDPSTR